MNIKKILALALAVLMVFGLTACVSGGSETKGTNNGLQTETPDTTPEENRYGGVLDIAALSDPGTADPHYKTGTEMYKFSTLVYENPLSQDTEGNIRPNVCEYELSEDGKTLKMWVREGVTFHDGSAVEIEDVIASIERAATFTSNVQKNFINLIESQTVENGVVTYTFSKYSPNTLYYISTQQTWAAVLPKEVCDKYGENAIADNADCIGTGPYKLVSYTSGVGYKTVRYDAYVAVPAGYTGEAAPKMAYLDAINVWINEDESSRNVSVQNGDYDVADISDDYVQLLLTLGGFKETYSCTYKTLYLGFNTNASRPTSDVNLRKAIACMVNITDFVAVHGCSYYTDPFVIAEGNQYYSDAFVKADYLAAGIEKAQEYLNKSNYNGEQIVLSAAKNEDIIVVLHAALQKLGLNVTIDYAGDSTFITDMNNAWDIVIAGATNVATYPALVPTALKSTYWKDEEKDELFSKLALEPIGSADSKTMWEQVVEMWVEDAPNVMLYTYSTNGVAPEDLIINNPGIYFTTYWNAYWTNPSEHMD